MFKVTERGQIVSIAIVAAVATIIAFGSLVQADFTGDDWHYLALLRHIDSPVEIITSNIAGAYFYRPVALLLFWLSEAVFSIKPVAHYGINVLLHGWVAFEVFALATTMTKARVISAWAATLFLLLPATSATALWVSDRFDLLATAMLLCSLRLMLRWARSATAHSGVLLGSLVMTVAAIGSKETAFALIPALLLVLLASDSRGSRSRWIAGGAVMLIAALAICCRVAALSGWKGDQTLPLTATAIGSGITMWLANFPVALQTHNGLYALLALGLAALAARHYGLRANKRSTDRRYEGLSSVTAVVMLLAGVVVAQSPVAATALPAIAANGAPLPTVSLRFFYTPLALLAILGALWFSRLTRSAFKPLWLAWTIRLSVISAVVIAALGSAKQSEMWAKNTSAEAQQAAVAVAEYASIAQQQLLRNQTASPCLVRLPSAPPLTDLDLRFKASLASADPRINCALLTRPAQAQTITRIGRCQSASLLPARSAIAGLEPWLRSGTCTFFFLGE